MPEFSKDYNDVREKAEQAAELQEQRIQAELDKQAQINNGDKNNLGSGGVGNRSNEGGEAASLLPGGGASTTDPTKEPSTRIEFSEAYNKNQPTKVSGFTGTPSLINQYAVYRYHLAAGNYNKLYDIGNNGITIDRNTPFTPRNPTSSRIIEWSQEAIKGRDATFGSSPYWWSDFLYCRDYGKIPNNYMITLRRFPIPVLDNLRLHTTSTTAKVQPPIAQAVTWMGQDTDNLLSEILGFTAGLNWKEIEADVQKVFGNEQGAGADPLSGTLLGTAAQTTNAFFDPYTYSGAAQQGSEAASRSHDPDGPYANQVYGPVNVIHKTMGRDRGMHFDSEYQISFHYSLKSIGSINPKIAMLDIIGNMLSLGYNNAKFWGGAIRYFPNHPNVPFIGGKAAQDAFHNGDIVGYLDAVVDGLSGTVSKGGDLLGKLLSDPLSAIKDLVMGGAKMGMAAKSAQNRPNLISMKSLLTGEPIGEWHLTVGNPMNPIAMIGNLICSDVEFVFGDVLGADDFPTELTVKYTLQHGKPRDKGDIESMFNFGSGRLYYSYPEGDNWFDPVDEADNPYSSGKNSIISEVQHKGNGSKGKNLQGSAEEQFDQSVNILKQGYRRNRGYLEDDLKSASKFFD